MVQQSRALATRRAILAAAAHVFERQGYAGAAMSEILAEARVTKGALYFHFESKEELARAVIHEQSDWLTAHSSGSSSPTQRLVDLGHAFADALRSDPLVRASIRLTIEHGTFSDPSRDAYETWMKVVLSLLQDADQRGELKPDVPLEKTAELIIGCVSGIQLVSEALAGREDLDVQMALLWRLLLPAMVPRRVLNRLVIRAGDGVAPVAQLPEEEPAGG